MNRDVERVAGELSEQDRSQLLAWPTGAGGWFTALPSSERRRFRKLIERAGICANRFTPLGEAVRSYLRESGQ